MGTKRSGFFNLFSSRSNNGRKKKKKTNQWFRDAVKSDTTKELLGTLQKTNSTVQAAIISKATGITIDPKDIKVQTSTQKFEDMIAEKAMEEIAADPNSEFVENAKQAMIFKLAGSNKGLFTRNMMNPDGDDSEYGPMTGGYFGPMGNSILEVMDQIDEIKERVGGKNAIAQIGNSEVLIELIRQIMPAILGKNAPAPGPTPTSQTIMVDIDGNLIEMTRQVYQIYKAQQEKIKMLNTGNGHKPAEQTVTAEPAAPLPQKPIETKSAEPILPVEPVNVIQEEPAQKKEINEATRIALLDIGNRLMVAMDQLSAEEFITNLEEEAKEDTTVLIIYEFLKNIESYDNAVSYLANLEDDERFTTVITKIKENKTWVDAVFDIIKNKNAENTASNI
jgi:hypothetical protein